MLIVLAVTACGGGVGGGSGSTTTPVTVTKTVYSTFTTVAITETVYSEPELETVTDTVYSKPHTVTAYESVTLEPGTDMVTLTVLFPPQTVTVRETLTITAARPTVPALSHSLHVIDAYESPSPASDLYALLGSSMHNERREFLARREGSASTTQSSYGKAVTASLHESNGQRVTSFGSFSLYNSHGWREQAGDPCRCSIHTRAVFHDAYGYELFSMVSNPYTVSITSPLHVSARHGVVQGLWYLAGHGFGLFSDGTRPTASLRTFGSARYVGSMYGMLVDTQGNARHREASAPLTMSVRWGDNPAVHGVVGNFDLYQVSQSQQGWATMSHGIMSSTLAFSGSAWNYARILFHDGTITCMDGCATVPGSRGVWNAHFVDTGTGAADPFILGGTFGMFKYELHDVEYDLIGFLRGNTSMIEPPPSGDGVMVRHATLLAGRWFRG